jgi:hypothetical protein
VHQPTRWAVVFVGCVFLLVGVVGLLAAGSVAPAGFPYWAIICGAGVFALFGGVPLAWIARQIIAPVRLRHARLDVLPSVPYEPLVQEGAIVHGRLTHELIEDADGWQFCPRMGLRRADMIFLYGFGVPFSIVFAAIITWIVHHELQWAGWIGAAFLAITVTLVCGGSTFTLIGMLMRSGFRQLSSLRIPRDGDVEFDSPKLPDFEKTDLATGLKWAFLGGTEREQLKIPRDLIAAVQLCPWKHATKGEITWAVQGLLVLTSKEEGVHHRLPLLLTNDLAGAAQLMQRLATRLGVPYLFCADAAGWRAEAQRAKVRPPLKVGGAMN